MGKARDRSSKSAKGRHGKKSTETEKQISRSADSCVPGFNNLGNTCYLNAILQVLIQTPELFSALQHAGPLSTQLLMLYQRLSPAGIDRPAKAKKRNKKGSCVTPKALFRICCELCSEIEDEDEMHDAHELLVFLLDTLQVEHSKLDGCLDGGPGEEVESVHGNRKNLEFYFGHHRDKIDPGLTAAVPEEPSEKDVVSELFGLRIETSVRCERCGNVTSSTSDNNVVSLPVMDDKRGTQTMQGCVAEMAEETYVENFACDKCKHRKGPREGAFLEERIVHTSDILVVHLKRFLYDMDHNGVVAVKLNTSVTIEPALHVESDGESLIFHAYATVCHHGKCIDSGHYIAHVKASDDHWYYCSDDEVYRISQEKALSSEAYIIFYRREQ